VSDDRLPSLESLYGWWWLHDARWYQGVARRFGFDAANEINHEALKYMAWRIARVVAKDRCLDPSRATFDEAVSAFSRCCELMWPEKLLQFEYRVTGPNRFEVSILRNFALEMLERAGTLGQYACPCLALREGWFQGLGVQASENRVVQCLRTGADCCTLVATLTSPRPVDTHGPPTNDGEGSERS
jgi:hypothetical protein